MRRLRKVETENKLETKQVIFMKWNKGFLYLVLDIKLFSLCFLFFGFAIMLFKALCCCSYSGFLFCYRTKHEVQGMLCKRTRWTRHTRRVKTIASPFTYSYNAKTSSHEWKLYFAHLFGLRFISILFLIGRQNYDKLFVFCKLSWMLLSLA